MNVRELLINQIGELVLTNIEQAAAIASLQRELEKSKTEPEIELLKQCAESGQMSAAQENAHREAGEL